MRKAVAGVAPAAGVDVVELSQAEFRRLNTPDFPTILLDGRGLFPVEGSRGCLSAGVSCCRVYATPEDLKGQPTK